MIYNILLTAIGLTPSGSSTVHIYPQTVQYTTIHIYTQTVKYSTHLHTNITQKTQWSEMDRSHITMKIHKQNKRE